MNQDQAGLVAPGFEPVAAAFDAGLPQCHGLGAAVSVRVGGRTVLERWGGVADDRTGRPWDERTLSVVFSCTKGLVAVLAAQLVEQGRLDYDELLTRYWPELGRRLRPSPSVGDLLAHRAGLSAPRADLTLEQVLDPAEMVRVLSDQEPLWTPGSGHAYHAITFGWLAGELIRRVTGQSLGEAFRSLSADPLDADAWIGLPPGQDGRVARLICGPVGSPTPPGHPWEDRGMTLGGALPLHLVDGDAGFNDPRLWHAEIGGAGGIATAHALATIWSATVVETDGVRLLDEPTVQAATVLRSSGVSAFGSPSVNSWGAGFMVPNGADQYLAASSFGHDGAGGQIAFADPVHRVGFAYLTNFMGDDADRRGKAVVQALREVLAG